MLDNPKAGITVWFMHGGQLTSGVVLTEKTIDDFYSVATPTGIPKLLKPEEMFESKEEVI